MFVINCKNYDLGPDGIMQLAKEAAAAAEEHGITIAIAPPQHLLGLAAKGPVPVLAQHVDDAKPGSTTGFVIPELLKSAGVSGSLINHSEHRISMEEIKSLVARLKPLGMASIVCARDAAEAGGLARIGPDYVAIEPPELIGSGRAVSQERPGIIRDAAAAMQGTGVGLLCGAGLVSGADVAKAAELGSHGVLVASGIIKAADRPAAISEFAKAMPRKEG